MNISRNEQRTLHALAQGGQIHYRRDAHGKIYEVDCFNRDGFRLVDCNLAVFNRLLRRRLIRSEAGQPYRITRDGLAAVRAQVDNR
ncbi:YjhX family toxin [Porphyrobacter sp. ULC335]|uniref:YjhX family toxin n=1 Tax=Porphyrobacter sp. ULC335 TaxID=2854260 RepID=UPI00221EF98F|nr:YjhX family toxin [Porphyrobacter sp. ULC335]UYV15776.1 YjhX family toxin [Porphyrobacter sp. ULC335]